MKKGRNDLCWCGSGIKYKYCHFPLDSAPKHEYLNEARRVYSENWKRNSSYYAQQGCYQWMTSILNRYSPKRILDIGCGDGRGLLSLVDNLTGEPQVISLDENAHCINETKSRLEQNNYRVSVIKRFVEEYRDVYHRIGIETGKLKEQSNISIIEADILLEDHELVSFLKDVSPFNAMTVWLVGSHNARKNCQNISELKIKSSEEYRLRVQNKCYEYADFLLAIGGVLQIVDRGEVPKSEKTKDSIISAHREQASVTSLTIESLEFKIYAEPLNSRKIALHSSKAIKDRKHESTELAMQSITSIKT